MKLIIRSAVAAAALLSAGSVYAAERAVTLSVKNMSCATCGPIVHKSLSRVAGVKHVDVAADKGTATIVFDDAVAKVSQLVAATTQAGYPSQPLPAKS